MDILLLNPSIKCGADLESGITHDIQYRNVAPGGHSHQLPYGGVPLYRVDFERPDSLK